MAKKNLTARQLVTQYKANCDRISEMAETLQKEGRERNEAENIEYEKLKRDNQVLQMQMQALTADPADPHGALSPREIDKIIRENVRSGQRTEIMLVRDMVMVTDANSGGIIPVRIKDILDPLVEGLILDKVGLPMPTGLSGEYVWPTYETVAASIADEGVALTDTKISMDKLTAAPQRIGIAIPVTRQTINQTDGIIELIVKKLMPLSISMLLNKILFSTATLEGATTLKGPFVNLKASAKEFAGAEPTFKELNSMKAEVLKTGIDGEHLCYVMTKSMKANLEATSKDAGSGIMVCEKDQICGLPVFTTNYIGEGYVGLGDWRYQPMGLFGDINFIIDPYTKARNDAIDFVLNANYGTVTLRKEAFLLKKGKGII